MFSAILVSKKRSTQKNYVQLFFEERQIRVVLKDEPELILATESLRLQLGGNNNSLLYIEAPELVGDILYLDHSHELMKTLAKMKGLQTQYSQIHSRYKKEKALVIITVVLGFCLIGSLIYWRGPIFGGIGQWIPFSIEKQLADKFIHPKFNKEQLVLINELNSLVKKLKFANSDWNDNFVLHISSATEPNAFATFGGHIFFNKGLLMEVKSPEQILGVVAHEMIHVQKRHVMRSVFQALGLFTVIQFLVGDFSGLAAILIDQGGPLLNLQYSRTLEEEADEFGMQLLIDNKVHPIGLGECLEIIMEKQKVLIAQSPGGEMLEKLQSIEILSSHPDPQGRIAHLKSKALELANQNETKQIDFDLKKFQSQVKEYF